MDDFLLLTNCWNGSKVAIRVSDISCIVDTETIATGKPYSKITLKNGCSCETVESAKTIVELIRTVCHIQEADKNQYKIGQKVRVKNNSSRYYDMCGYVEDVSYKVRFDNDYGDSLELLAEEQ